MLGSRSLRLFSSSQPGSGPDFISKSAFEQGNNVFESPNAYDEERLRAALSLATPPDELGQARRSRALFAMAMVGVALYVVLDAVAQSLPPHYSLLSQPESDLAVGPYGYIMTLNFITRGVLSLCFLFALALTANSGDVMGRRFRRGGYLFAVWSVGALLLAAFPTDVPSTPLSWHGAVHLAVAVAAFLGGASGAFYLTLGMARN